ncbi:MAG TPA: B-box zinc finger protein [Candidatus Acidoferrum sp.]
MKCAVHTDVDASGYCRNCGKPMCAACARPVRDVLYCEDCLATVMGHAAPAPNPATAPPPSSQPAAPPAPIYPAPAGAPYQRQSGRSSPTAAFVLGLVPGLGAIYNGQYNKGLIHIAIVASIIMGFISDMDGGFKAMLAIFLGGFVFYCAFDAMRTAQAKNNGEVPPDPLESWSAGRPVGPIILIGLGVLLLLGNFGVLESLHFGRLWPIILIGAGLYMFRNKLGGRQ